ncbi:MAG: hypothetical protein KDD04_09510, partial [Sinomicrobium sp.]|nr:hypothetical protein [Sinomicrobium sp.]
MRKPHVEAVLAAEESSIQPGRSFWIAVHFQLDQGWHTYWKNPGDSGLATEITLTLPEGFKPSPLQWPAPEIISRPPLVTYGYKNEVFHLFKIDPPQGIPADSRVQISAEVT